MLATLRAGDETTRQLGPMQLTAERLLAAAGLSLVVGAANERGIAK